MIQKIENIKKQYFIPAAAPANQQQNKNETQQKLIKAGSYIALAGSLAGLAGWGYSSIKKFNIPPANPGRNTHKMQKLAARIC